MSVEERSALPKTNKVLPGSFFSLMTSSTTLSFTSLVLFQSAFLSVFENKTFGIVVMKSATSPFWVGQYSAIPSSLTRPNNSMPVDFDCSMAYCSNSSPQMVSCQSISQLFGPSKKPSSVTRFHMMSLGIPFTRIQRGQSLKPDISAVVAVRATCINPEPGEAVSSKTFIRSLLAPQRNLAPESPARRTQGRSRYETEGQFRVQPRSRPRPRGKRIGTRSAPAADRRYWQRPTPGTRQPGIRRAGKPGSAPTPGLPPRASSPTGPPSPAPATPPSPRPTTPPPPATRPPP